MIGNRYLKKIIEIPKIKHRYLLKCYLQYISTKPVGHTYRIIK